MILRTCKIIFPSGWTILHPHSDAQGFFISLYPYNTCDSLIAYLFDMYFPKDVFLMCSLVI